MDFHGDFNRLHDFVREKLSGSGSCHDFDHTLRVLNNAKLLLNSYPQADAEVVILSALLHDIARPEEDCSKGKICHAKAGAGQIPEILRNHGFPENIAARAADAVRTHRYRGKDKPASLEAELLFDADKLDSLGAVGIGRAFLFAGHENARLHNTEEEALSADAYSKNDTAYREFLVKLQYLPRKMRTAAGRKMAVERAAFMTAFFDRLDHEINLQEHTGTNEKKLMG